MVLPIGDEVWSAKTRELIVLRYKVYAVVVEQLLRP